MGKHTPERTEYTPWELRHNADHGCYEVNDCRGAVVADVWAQHHARLIAAAPELLELCKIAFAINDAPCRADHHGYCQEHNLEPVETCWVKRLRDAIAKAEASPSPANHRRARRNGGGA